jgi:uncharacterized protein (TIGR03437 family)
MTCAVRRLIFALALGSFCAMPAAAQCTFSLSPVSMSFTAAGGGGQIAISGTTGCARTAVSNVPWATISFGQQGSGSGSAAYTVLANTTPAARTGTLTIAGQTFTITQAAANCSFDVTPNSATAPGSGGSGSFEVTANCSWTAVTNAPWITLTGGTGTGSATVRYTAAPNSGSQRTGAISVGNATFTLTQSQPCTFSFSSSGARVAAAGGSFTVLVTASSNTCERSVTSTAPWITITSGAAGTGNSQVGYTITANTTGESRLGAIRAGEQTFVISQDGSTCLYTLTPSVRTMPVNGGTGIFTVTTGTACPWSAESTVDWVTITAGGSGAGNGTVTYAVAANLRNEPRTTAIAVGNTAFLLSQPAAGCTISANPESVTVASDGGTGIIEISGPAACGWTASKSADWLTLTGPVSGTGDGTVRYSVAPNPSIQTRNGLIIIANAQFRVVQAAANCNVSIGSASIPISAAGGSASLAITANCQWQAAANVPWIQLTSPAAGNGDATLTFTVQANSGTASRTGNIVVNGQTLVVTQPAQTCSLTVTPLTLTLPAVGGSGTATITGSGSCNWNANSSDPWLETSWASANGSGTVTVIAKPNATGTERLATVAVSGSRITVRQLAIQLASNGLVHAATFQPGPVAPGEIVTIFGSRFGPAVPVTSESSQPFPKVLGGTRVLFDGVPAPLIYATEGQVSAIVPYALAGKTTAQLAVEYIGAMSNTVSMAVSPASPGIFTLNMSGTGPGAILNQDFSLNLPQAPAARGSIVQIFATGEGQTRPGGVDGKLAAAPLPAPVLPVSVTIGGLPATVTYAGGAPGLVAGVIQINARIPDGVAPGPAVPIVIRAGDFASPEGVTLSVR